MIRALLAAVALLLSSCGSCPDLALVAIAVDNTADVDPALVTVTITRDGDTVAADVPLAAPRDVDAGVYDVTFTLDGADTAELTGVCTVGGLRGCDAEDAGEEATALVTLSAPGGVFAAELTRNGDCP